MLYVCFFFFNDTATTEIYTLSLHDALPISRRDGSLNFGGIVTRHSASVLAGLPMRASTAAGRCGAADFGSAGRSEEHTSELQSRLHLVCRLLLEKKKENHTYPRVTYRLLKG